MNTLSRSIPLPDKPSALIRLAMSDLAVCESQPEAYKIDMGKWRERKYGPNGLLPCAVCLAGAVMAQRGHRLADDMGDGESPYAYDFKTEQCLMALDLLRCGMIQHAIDRMGLPWIEEDELPTRVRIAHYHHDPIAFVADMESLAVLLETHNL